MAGMITLMVADITTWWCLGSLRIRVLRAELCGFASQNHFFSAGKPKPSDFLGMKKSGCETQVVNKCHCCFILNHFSFMPGHLFKNLFSFFWCFSEASRTGLPHSPWPAPVEDGSLYHYLQRFYHHHPRWENRISSINSSVEKKTIHFEWSLVQERWGSYNVSAMFACPKGTRLLKPEQKKSWSRPLARTFWALAQDLSIS